MLMFGIGIVGAVGPGHRLRERQRRGRDDGEEQRANTAMTPRKATRVSFRGLEAADELDDRVALRLQRPLLFVEPGCSISRGQLRRSCETPADAAADEIIPLADLDHVHGDVLRNARRLDDGDQPTVRGDDQPAARIGRTTYVMPTSSSATSANAQTTLKQNANHAYYHVACTRD